MTRVVAITGAGGGLGRSTALRMATAGSVIACSDSDEQAAAETLRLITDAGGRGLACRVDITSEDDVRLWHKEITASIGPVSTLLNVAGILDRRMMKDLSHANFLRSLEINVGGPYLVTRVFADDLTSAENGRVVNIASIAGVVGYPYPGYAASKAAVVNLTRTLLLDFWGSGVTINAVCPGAMDTPMMNRQAIPQMEAKTPIGRVATPDDVAGVIEFLCTPTASCINGATIVVDGGATAVFRYFEG